MIQLNWYRQQVEAGLLNFVKSKRDLPSPRDETAAGPLAAIMLMEGADAVRSPADVPEWFEYGLRIVGLAWRRTRSAGGTGEPGPLTDEGRVWSGRSTRRGSSTTYRTWRMNRSGN